MVFTVTQGENLAFADGLYLENCGGDVLVKDESFLLRSAFRSSVWAGPREFGFDVELDGAWDFRTPSRCRYCDRIRLEETRSRALEVLDDVLIDDMLSLLPIGTVAAPQNWEVLAEIVDLTLSVSHFESFIALNCSSFELKAVFWRPMVLDTQSLEWWVIWEYVCFEHLHLQKRTHQFEGIA